MSQLNIGKLIKILTKIREERGDEYIYFDFCNLTPSGINFWRGNHQEIAVHFGNGNALLTDFISLLIKAKREFKIKNTTKLWVANHNEVGSTAITGIEQTEDGWIIIKTKYKQHQNYNKSLVNVEKKSIELN